MFGASRPEKAYLAPYAAILACLLLGGLVHGLFEGRAAWWAAAPMYWNLPLQTVVAGYLLVRGWMWYGLRPPLHARLALAAGVLAWLGWISPGFLGAAPRTEGFDPSFFGPSLYAPQLAVRLLRLVVVVPLAEELFWRGFLARYLVRPDFLSVPVGAFTLRSFWITTAGFCLEHTMADWPAALFTGLLYNGLAWRTRSLSACVLAHAVTNALLGAWVLHTQEWGYW